MILFSSIHISKFSCILLLLICFAQSFPLPQYDNVEIEEEIEEDIDVDQDQGNVPEVPVPAAGEAAVDNSALLFKLPANYSVHKAPPLIDKKPIAVELGFLLFNVFDIREIQEEISLEVNYKLQWKDTRLKNWTKNIEPGQKYIVLNPSMMHKIWHPDIFIDYVKRVTQPMIISQAASLRIYSDGSMRYSARTLIVLTCRMDFHYYPADTQECNVTIKSYGFADSQIALSWKEGIGALMAKSMDVHNFDVALVTHPDFVQVTKSNNYTALSFGVRLRRKLSYHLIQTYVPSTLFTIVSWLSFLVPPDSTPGRMAICVTTLLTVTSMFGSVKSNTPNVSYIKALDIWMFMCIVFIFLSLAEFTIVLKLRSKKKKPKPPAKKRKWLSRKEKTENNVVVANNTRVASRLRFYLSNSLCTCHTGNQEGNAINSTRALTPSLPIVSPPPPPTPVAPPPKPTKYFVLAARIEKWAPRIIPLVFLGCNCLYWPYLLIASEFFELNIDPDMYYSVQK